MNYEEQISELKKRIEVLEKAEHKRVVKRRREIIFKLVKFAATIVILVLVALWVYNNYIKPYQEKIDYYDEKIKNVESYIKDKSDFFDNFDLFS